MADVLKQQQWPPKGAGCLAIVLALGGGVWLLGQFGDGTPSAPEDPCARDSAAWVMATQFVERRLKAPSTAKFPWMSDDGVSVSRLPGCKYRVIGYVDAQNSFGAKLRNRFVVELGPETPGSDTWTASAVEILQ